VQPWFLRHLKRITLVKPLLRLLTPSACCLLALKFLIHIDTITAFTGSTAANVTIGDGSTAALYWASTDITAQGRAAISNAATKLGAWSGAATTASPNGAGIGSTDVKIVATLTPTVAAVTAGTVQYTIIYTVANSDGNQFPASA